MGTACFRVAANENLVLGIEEDDAGGEGLANAFEDFGETVEG